MAIRKTTKGKNANYRPTKKGAGMTKKGVAAYRKANPGSKLKTAVTGKVKAGSKSAKRRKSYCARSLGQLKNSSAELAILGPLQLNINLSTLPNKIHLFSSVLSFQTRYLIKDDFA